MATAQGLQPSTTLQPISYLQPSRYIETPSPPPDSLQNGEYEIDGLVFGTRDPRGNPNPYLVQTFSVIPGTLITGVGGNLSSSSAGGSSGTTSADASYPNEDGTKFGQDYYTGMTLEIGMNVWQRSQQVYNQIGQLKGIWRNPKFRKTSNAVTSLRICRGGRTRLVYGRPRNFRETYGEVEQGWSPISMTFQCSDEIFYDDEVQVKNIGLVNPPVDGLVFPNTLPWVLSQYQEQYTTIHVGGETGAWPQFIINGPCTNPTIQYDSDWVITLLISLDHTQTITIDPRPWYRMTLLHGVTTTNISGAYTADSPVMRNMQFFPGQHTVLFGGIDPTQTSYLTVAWRDAYTTP